MAFFFFFGGGEGLPEENGHSMAAPIFANPTVKSYETVLSLTTVDGGNPAPVGR